MKQKKAEYDTAYRRRNKDRIREREASRRADWKEAYGIAMCPRRIQREYGCTGEEYKQRMDSSSVCQCCGQPEDLVYDHNHETMEFRGVLCRQCNQAAGLLGDTKQGVVRLLAYLEGELYGTTKDTT